jgi:phosphoglycolate phosphatase
VAVRAVLFDLDGTLVQTRAASWELFEETNRRFGLGVDTRDRFFTMFENNFYAALSELCPDPAKFAEVRAHFLDLLRTRYRPPFIPGMADVVRSLADRFTLVVISSNTIETIRGILTRAGLAHCFAHVFAGDVEPDKAASMRRFIADSGYKIGRRCAPAYDEGAVTSEDRDDVVLVTDTVGDVREAAVAGVRAIGVAWGMHRESDLREAGAERVALWPQELSAWLSAESDALPGPCSCTASTPCANDLARSASSVRRERRRDGIERTARARAIGERPKIDDDLLTTLKRLRKGSST